MKKILFTLLFALPVMAMAQSSDVNVYASVNDAITLTKVSDLVFGNITDTSTDAVIAADGTITNTGTAATPAQITSSAVNSVVYSITGAKFDPVSNVLTLDEVGTGTSELEVLLSYGIGENAATYTPGNGTGASGSATANTLSIGGTIAAADLQAATGNSFTGQITVTASFN
ncbi:MAG: DUF4402 domain-containing protein [Bacteroidetes bacterium]|nr:DUF4402 domain-containing protein [Bacteroidota bacterium]